jgi:hypothetical protein
VRGFAALLCGYDLSRLFLPNRRGRHIVEAHRIKVLDAAMDGNLSGKLDA